ncbi:MAG: hypothetical protein QOG87_3387 [Actinomycetota bacterium]|jgi:hypothetical protein
MGSAGSRLLRILLVGAIAGLSVTFWTFADVAYACDPVTGEGCDMSPPPEEEEEDPPETSPPHTSPPHTSPPATRPPATSPPATHAPVTQKPTVGKSNTATTRSHTATTRRTSSGQSDTPTAPSEPFLDVPVAPTAPIDTGVQLPAVQLAGDAKAAPGVGTAADAGLPPETRTSSGGGDPKLALALAAAGVALLGAPLLTKKSCDEATAAAVRSQIAAVCWEVSTAKSDLASARARHANAMVAISQFHTTEAAVSQAHAGIDAIRATRNWRWWGKRTAQVTLATTAGVVGGASVKAGQAALAGARYTFLGGAGGYFGLPGADPVHSIDHLPEDMGAADFEAALAKAHADINALLGSAGDLMALQAARDAATADANAAAGRLAAAQADLQAAQARWTSACGPAPECGA